MEGWAGAGSPRLEQSFMTAVWSAVIRCWHLILRNLYSVISPPFAWDSSNQAGELPVVLWARARLRGAESPGGVLNELPDAGAGAGGEGEKLPSEVSQDFTGQMLKALKKSGKRQAEMGRHGFLGRVGGAWEAARPLSISFTLGTAAWRAFGRVSTSRVT